MPTLAELLAAKGGREAAQGTAPPTNQRGEGTVIRAEDDRARLAADIKRSLDLGAPKVRPQRELGEMEKGEQIPMDHPAADAPESEWEWFDCLHSFETELGVVIEPGEQGEAKAAWLALQWGEKRPLLLHRLPVLNRPCAGNPF